MFTCVHALRVRSGLIQDINNQDEYELTGFLHVTQNASIDLKKAARIQFIVTKKCKKKWGLHRDASTEEGNAKRFLLARWEHWAEERW